MKYTQMLGVLAILGSTSVLADSYGVPVANSGLVSMFPGQTARLNVVNIGGTGPCSFTASLIDTNGNTLSVTDNNGHVLSQPLTVSGLAGGQFIYLDGVSAVPTQVRARIDFSQQALDAANATDPMAGCYKIIPTLEVITNNVSTDVLNTTFYGLPSSEKGQKMEYLRICHKPGTPAAKSLWLPVSAWKGHRVHGDTLGNCAPL